MNQERINQILASPHDPDNTLRGDIARGRQATAYLKQQAEIKQRARTDDELAIDGNGMTKKQREEMRISRYATRRKSSTRWSKAQRISMSIDK